MNISDVIRELVPKYLDKYQLKSAYDINNGLCEDFAHAVCQIIPEADGRWGDELEDPEAARHGEFESPFHGHMVIEYDGRYYDAECPDGVDHWDDIPFFKKVIEFAFEAARGGADG